MSLCASVSSFVKGENNYNVAMRITRVNTEVLRTVFEPSNGFISV